MSPLRGFAVFSTFVVDCAVCTNLILSARVGSLTKFTVFSMIFSVFYRIATITMVSTLRRKLPSIIWGMMIVSKLFTICPYCPVSSHLVVIAFVYGYLRRFLHD